MQCNSPDSPIQPSHEHSQIPEFLKEEIPSFNLKDPRYMKYRKELLRYMTELFPDVNSLTPLCQSLGYRLDDIPRGDDTIKARVRELILLTEREVQMSNLITNLINFIQQNNVGH